MYKFHSYQVKPRFFERPAHSLVTASTELSKPRSIHFIRELEASVVQRQRAGLWYPSSRFHTRPKPSDFQGEKILSTPSFGGEVKLSVPCRSFTACKRYLNLTYNSAFRQNYRTFLTHSSTLRRWVLSRGDTRGDAWWRKLKRLTQIAQ